MATLGGVRLESTNCICIACFAQEAAASYLANDWFLNAFDDMLTGTDPTGGSFGSCLSFNGTFRVVGFGWWSLGPRSD